MKYFFDDMVGPIAMSKSFLLQPRFSNNLIDFLIIFFSKPFLPQCKEATILFLKSATNIGIQSAV